MDKKSGCIFWMHPLGIYIRYIAISSVASFLFFQDVQPFLLFLALVTKPCEKV